MRKRQTSKVSKKQARANRNIAAAAIEETPVQEVAAPRERKTVEIPAVLSVKDFAGYLDIPVTQVIAALMRNGVMATLNENIDSETAMIVGDELGFDVSEQKEATPTTIELVETKEDKKNRTKRPPVVTIMGHVDHGKTTLLDTVRRTNVVASESGGITQHIGAYQVLVPASGGKGERLITFLDTPGHEAFSAMRAHGAAITDIVILVVAADDGVKPQTVEAINHARAAGVPIIVAINKIDLPSANPDRVKQELAERELTPEDWGGQTIMVPISAKKGDHVDELLEMVLLVADLKELTSNPKKLATGVVIESHMQAGVGPLATILVNDGTLHQGDVVVVGDTWGKIRFMEDYRGKRIKEATASIPVRVAGLNSVPNYGEPVVTAESEKVAREMTQVKSAVRKHIGMAEISEAISEGKLKELKIVLKTDVQGSLEAIRTSVNQLSTADITVQIINEGVGNITESDINMAETAGALVIGFRTSITPPVRQLAERKGIKVSIYEIIYQLLDDLYAALAGLLEPEKVEVRFGTVEILQVFHSTKDEQIVGGRVTSGKVEKGASARIMRLDESLGEAIVRSVRREAEEVETVVAGTECGVGLRGDIKPSVGDTLEIFRIEERMRKLG